MSQEVSPFPSVTSNHPCNLCDSSTAEVVGTMDRDGKSLRTAMCSRCGLVWTDPRPTELETRNFYENEYRLAYKSTYTPRLKHALRETVRAVERADRWAALLSSSSRVLDIGSAGGFFLYVMRQRGARIQGVEPNRGFAEFAQTELGVPTLNTFLQDVDLPTASFDIVTAHHVFEHLEDPVQSLRRIQNWVVPGGYVLLEVPNVEACYHAPRNRYHIGHLHSFNAFTLEGIGRKAGLEVVSSTTSLESDHIVVLFRRPVEVNAVTASPPTYENPKNAARVRRILQGHTTLSHYLSMTPYWRVAQKQLGYVREWIQTRPFRSSRQVVESLVGKPPQQ